METRDIVCGMAVNPKRNPIEYKHKGKTYYFCSAQCLEDFKKDPEKYISEDQR